MIKFIIIALAVYLGSFPVYYYVDSKLEMLKYELAEKKERKKNAHILPTLRYKEDKIQIANSLSYNFEEYRKICVIIENQNLPTPTHGLRNSVFGKYETYQPEYIYYGGLFSKYTTVILDDQNSEAGYKKVAFKIPMKEFMTVSIDTIAYSSDSLLCVALALLEIKTQKGLRWNAFGVIGVRDSINSSFRVYPKRMMQFSRYNNKKLVTYHLRSFYYKDIIGCGLPNDNSKIKYTCGIGESDFFITSPDFRKVDGMYRFEYYEDCDREKKQRSNVPIKYPSNLQPNEADQMIPAIKISDYF